jgi:hypothetical protein
LPNDLLQYATYRNLGLIQQGWTITEQDFVVSTMMDLVFQGIFSHQIWKSSCICLLVHDIRRWLKIEYIHQYVTLCWRRLGTPLLHHNVEGDTIPQWILWQASPNRMH